tara:strand:- start:3226 stop:3801 length:576 start_codon:yes stop_codon:yes gene_type:complete
MKKIILLSGGFDSALMLADESNKDPKHEIYALSIDYGQRHYVELEYAEKLAEKYGVIKHKIISMELPYDSLLTGEDMINSGPPVVPNRNAIFLALAIGWAETLDCHDIYIGSNKDDHDNFPDCRRDFFDRQESASLYPVRIHTPLINSTKEGLFQERKLINEHLVLEMEETMSCYNGTNCGVCDACRQRNV